MAHFLRPVGTKGNDIPEKEGAFDAKKIVFSKDRKPKFNEGHIIILFAHGSQKLVTYLSAVSPLLENTEDEENPWYIQTKDWAPEYSKKWWQSEKTITALAAEYLALNPDNKLGAAKKLDAGTFATALYGKSNLEIHTDFAYFLIDRIKAGAKQ